MWGHVLRDLVLTGMERLPEGYWVLSVTSG